MDIRQAFASAAGLLEAGHAAEAAAVLGPMARAHPGDPAVRHLHGLALYERGDAAAAAAELRAALAVDDRPAQVHLDLAEMLRATGDIDGMGRSLGAALARDPGFIPAAAMLADWLVSQDRADEALAVTLAMTGRSPDPAAVGLHLEILRAAGRADEAIAVIEGMVARSGGNPALEQDLALRLVEAERYADGEGAADRAIARGQAGPEVRRVRARALQGLGRFDEAEAGFREALERRPDFAMAHRDLAQLVWMRTADADLATEALDAAIAAHPAATDLSIIKAQLLDYAGRTADGYAVLAPLVDRPAADPVVERIASQLALTLDPGRALAHAERALSRTPHDADALVAAAEAGLAAGQPDLAARRAQALLNQAPFNQQAIALQTTAWRLLGDPRYAALCDYERVVQTRRLEPPAGWASLEAWLAALAEALNGMHGFKAHPVGQSLRQGSQTSQSLDRAVDPAIRGFFDAIRAPIRSYVDGLGAGRDPLRARRRDDFRLSGSWSVRLQPGGRHVNHVHPAGWLSSACYVALPDAVEGGGREGWISFGEPGVPTVPPLPAEHWVKPEPGLLVLFPSYLWHGTAPFGGDQSRLTCAFDVRPAGRGVGAMG